MSKRIISLLTAIIILCLSVVTVNAVSFDEGKDALIAQFNGGSGPEVNGFSIDYNFYSPIQKDLTKKYPLVIWLHGMGDGAEHDTNITKSNISYWTSDEFQSRFESAGGAFIFVPRSLEEDMNYWGDNLIEPLKAAIDSFIRDNQDNVDLSRIYVGGYSMGGKMTLKMAVAYPEMFAAIFPICPAWSPADSYLENIKDIPTWIVSSKKDPLVNYYLGVTPLWNHLTAMTTVAEDCRFSTLTTVCYEDGTKTSSSHHSWFAVNHDLFASDGGDYHYMSTINGKGEEVKLAYPDGMISWLDSHTSDYKGEKSEGTGKLDISVSSDRLVGINSIGEFFELLWFAISDIFSF